MISRLIPCLLMLSCLMPVHADDWLQFRGTNNNGIVSGAPLPADLNTIAWEILLEGRGVSSPIIVGDRVYVTSSAGFRQNQLMVTCFAAEDGKKLWQREFWATGRTICHPKMAVATPTPASDGQRIFAFYSSNDVICLDLDGNLLWYRGLTYDYPNVSNSLGMSSSLVVKNGVLVCMAENDTESMTFGLDVADGTTKWKLDRPRAANWTSPIVWPGSEDWVMLQSSKGVAAVDIGTGEVAWEYLDGASTTPSLIAVDNIAYVPSNGLTAIKPGISDPKTPEILWQVGQMSPGTASPLVYDDYAYVINRSGVLSAASLEDGQRAWQCRMTPRFSATPIISAGRLYAFNEDGLGQVVQLSAESGEVIATRELNDTILATPSAANGALYVRSDKTLWKFE